MNTGFPIIISMIFFLIWFVFLGLGIFIAVLIIKVLLKLSDALDIYIMKNKDNEAYRQ